MTPPDVRRLLAERLRLLRRDPKVTPSQRRAFDAYRQAAQYLKWAAGSLRLTSINVRQQERWVASRRVVLDRQLAKVEAALHAQGLSLAALGLSRARLDRLPDVDRLAPVQALARRARALPRVARPAEKAVQLAKDLRATASYLAQRQRALQRVEAKVVKHATATQAARTRLKKLGL